MLLGTRKNLYDHILEALLKEPRTASDLKNSLESHFPGVTMQGIYKGLRELMSEDIIVKQKKLYAVSNVWREKAADLFTKRIPFRLSEGEHTIYRFRKIVHLDAFWKHTITDIEQELSGFPIFHFTAHQFWFLVPGREQNEREYYINLERDNTNIYTIIGGATILDKEMQKLIRTEHHHVHLNSSTDLNRRDHLSVIGNYIIITRISNTLAKSIDEAYLTITDQSILGRRLGQLFVNPGAISLLVEYNKKKAHGLRKKIAKNFHVAKELREKFDLF